MKSYKNVFIRWVTNQLMHFPCDIIRTLQYLVVLHI